MGRANSGPDVNHATPTMKHLSHPHELQLCNSQNLPQAPNASTVCSGCKLPPSGITMYICRPCNFILHSTCAQFPQLITHPSHSNHTLTLLPTSSYLGGKFKCDACNHQGDGFSYHCSLCDFDLHIMCASKPLKITHQLHPCELQLTFQNPYNNSKGFSCDVCSKIGSRQWLYRCSACEFDVHLDCTTTTATARPISTIQAQATIQHHTSVPGVIFHNQFQAPINANQGVGSVRPTHYMHSASMGVIPNNQNQFQPPMAAGQQVHGSVRPYELMHSASTGSMPNHQPPGGTVQNYQASSTDGLMNAAMQGLVEGAAQQVGQIIMQSIIGGG